MEDSHECIRNHPSLPIRLLGQLDETETAFDDFWERHCTKLEQCLQLRHFELHFREVSSSRRLPLTRVWVAAGSSFRREQ